MTDLSIIEDDDASYLSIDQILMEEQKLTCQSRYNFLDLDFRRAKEGKFGKSTFSGNRLFRKIDF